MCSYSELIQLEDALKEKHIDIIRNMSHLELKKFSKGKYKEKLLKELKQQLPGYDNETQLSETSQCEANTLCREANSKNKSRVRESTSAKNVSALLSDTVIADLDSSLHTDATHGLDPPPPDHECDDVDDGDDSGEESDNESQQDHDANDSITQLKQIDTTDNETTDHSNTTKPKQNNADQSEKTVCIQICKIKPNSKQQYDRTRCTLCLMWYHDKCVGLDKDEPIGLWLCPSCRNTLHVLKNDVTCLKNDVKSIKECTESILTAVNGLSTKLEDCVGELHDRITAYRRTK